MAITLNINGRAVQAPDGSLGAGRHQCVRGRTYPSCAKTPRHEGHRRVSDVPSWRSTVCGGVPASCGVPATDGMRVSTEGVGVRDIRKKRLATHRSR